MCTISEDKEKGENELSPGSRPGQAAGEEQSDMRRAKSLARATKGGELPSSMPDVSGREVGAKGSSGMAHAGAGQDGHKDCGEEAQEFFQGSSGNC